MGMAVTMIFGNGGDNDIEWVDADDEKVQNVPPLIDMNDSASEPKSTLDNISICGTKSLVEYKRLYNILETSLDTPIINKKE